MNCSPARDAFLIYGAALLRSTAVGVLGVVLGIFLAERGLSVTGIGLVIGSGIAGTAMVTATVSWIEDRLGRKRALIALALLAGFGCLAPALWTQLGVLMPCAFVGTLNGMGRDRGPTGALEQALLPGTTAAARRTWVLAWYNVVLDAGHALGALAGTLPTLLVSRVGISIDRAHVLTLLMCAGTIASSAVPYTLLSSRVREGRRHGVPQERVHDPAVRRAVVRLSLLFGLDSLGGGFLSSALIAFWFFERYGLSERDIALLFFASRVLNAASHVGAAWLARRVGLLNTMVFTHLPSSLFLLATPAGSTAAVAGSLFLAREALVEMDVPTRQSYVMAIVPPDERAFASGITNSTRTIAWAIGPGIAGFVMQHLVLAGPLLIGGTLKIVYDLLLYASFRRIRPPEERAPC